MSDFNKIVALDKEIILPNEIYLNSVERADVLSVLREINEETALRLEGIPFRVEIKDKTLYIYRTDAFFG